MNSSDNHNWYWDNDVSFHPVILVARAADAISWGAVRTRRLKILREVLKEFHSVGRVDQVRLAKAWLKVYDFARFYKTPACYFTDALKALYSAINQGHNSHNKNMALWNSLLQSNMPWDLMLSCVSSRDETTAAVAARVCDGMLYEGSTSVKMQFMKILRHYDENSKLFDPRTLLSPRLTTTTTTNILAFLSDYIYYGEKEGTVPFPHLTILSLVEAALKQPEPGAQKPTLTPYLLLLSILSSSSSPEAIDGLARSSILLEVIAWLGNLDGQEWCGYIDYALRLVIALACTSISANRIITANFQLRILSHIMVHYDEADLWLIATLVGWVLSFTVVSRTDIDSAIELAKETKLDKYGPPTRAYMTRFFGNVSDRVDFRTMQNLLHEWYEHEHAKCTTQEGLSSSIEGQIRTCMRLLDDIQPQTTHVHVPFKASRLSICIEEE